MILCDTNVLIETYRGNNHIIDVLKNIEQQNIAVSDVTCAELLYGARNKKELTTIRKDLNKLTILPIQTAISSLSVELVEKYTLSHKLSLPDAIIGATALIHDIALFNLNLEDFKFIENLKISEVK